MKTVRVKIVLSFQMEDGVESGVSANTDQGELEILHGATHLSALPTHPG